MLDVSLPALAVTVHFVPLPIRAIASLASRKPLGLELPGAGKRLDHILWNGPNSWLFLDTEATDLAARTGAAVTDQSDGLFSFAVTGPFAVAILKKLLPIDIERFAPDDVAITSAAHIGVRVWREGDAYILACFRSFAVALHHALAEAAEEFSPGRG
jgi:sarcosine oxidase subunit gamma